MSWVSGIFLRGFHSPFGERFNRDPDIQGTIAREISWSRTVGDICWGWRRSEDWEMAVGNVHGHD